MTKTGGAVRSATGLRELAARGIDPDRLLRRLDELGEIGGDRQGGVTRPGFSEQDRQGQRYLMAEAAQSGLTAQVDAAGNVIFRRQDARLDRQVLLIGSHLDTVTNGGRLDGAYGVVAGLEVLHALAECDHELALEPVVVAFANEEGTLFPQPFWGSMVFSGRQDDLPSAPVDRLGRSLREPLRLAGGHLDALHTAVWPRGSVAAYLELHIEQGPVLETAGVPIGVVDSIVGRSVFEVEVHGVAGHAGTTPMDHRKDALAAASRLVLAAEKMAADGVCRVATTGHLAVRPDATNVVPGWVGATVEFRDGRPEQLTEAEETFLREVAEVQELTSCVVESRRTMRVEPVATDERLQNAVATAAGEAGHDVVHLPSGAGHDAQIIASIAPIGMIFVPSRDGLSHVPEEHTDPENLVIGTEVLLRAACSLVAG